MSVRTFLADVARLSALLGGGAHVLNVCADRYQFAVGFAAALTAGKVSLLPPTHTPEVIERLKAFAPDVVCLTDDEDCPVALPQVRCPAGSAPAGASALPVPQIDPGQIVACVFTSGSTGTPIPYRKTWAPLMSCVREEARRLGIATLPRAVIVATVPPQHMYGFESIGAHGARQRLRVRRRAAVLPGRHRHDAGARAATARPGLDAGAPAGARSPPTSTLPRRDLVVSATAPLSQQLAAGDRAALRHAARWRSTARPRPARSPRAARPRPRSGACGRRSRSRYATGRPGRTADTSSSRRACATCSRSLGEERFLLHGRARRPRQHRRQAQLACLPQPPAELHRGRHRRRLLPLRATTRAPQHRRRARRGLRGRARLDAARSCCEALRERIDPVFLPRPLLFVARLPRNSTGKLPQEALRALAAAHLQGLRGLSGAMGTPVTVTISPRPSGVRGPLSRRADRARACCCSMRRCARSTADGAARASALAHRGREIPEARPAGRDTARRK